MSLLKLEFVMFLGLLSPSTLFAQESKQINLKALSNLYVPAHYHGGEPRYEYGSAAAEQFDIDLEDKIIYAVGSEEIHVIDMSDVSNLRILAHMPTSGFECTDIEFCGDYVFVSMDNLVNKEEGQVVIFKKYDRQTKTFEAYRRLIVGPLPDMIKPNHDCSKAVVAIEGEPYQKDGSLIDPEGGVGIISINVENVGNEFSYKLLDFQSFNSRTEELVAAGVRKSNPTGTLSRDLEPEYVAYNDKHSVAYIALQENNAIAVVDVQNERIHDIYPMGEKRWSDSSLDLSKNDGGISMKPWPVYGLYQPDTILYTTFNDIGYLLTANEGDEREYNEDVSNGYIDTIKGKDLAQDLSKLDLPQDMIGYLQDDSELGKAHFSTVDGINADTGKYEKLYTFGGRSFSIIRTDTMEMVYDSGNSVELSIAQSYPYLFNADKDSDKTPSGQMDDRSPKKGPECESLAVGEIGGKTLIFLGNERPGLVSVYTVTNDMSNPVFSGIWSGIPDSHSTYQQLFDERKLMSVDPEDMKFIPAEKSPNKENLLIVAGSESGTITVLEVKEDDKKKKRSPVEPGNNTGSLTMRLLMGNLNEAAKV